MTPEASASSGEILVRTWSMAYKSEYLTGKACSHLRGQVAAERVDLTVLKTYQMTNDD